MAETPTSDDLLRRPPTDEELDQLQFTTLLYYLHETNPDNGLVRDKTDPTAPVSIAAVGMALATVPVVVERGVIVREFAAKTTRTRLRYLLDCPQGPEADASGYKGFFYHFLDIETGRRVWQCELSTIDSAFLFAGALTVATYFDRDTETEVEIRRLAEALYQRADWNWACNGGPTLTHGCGRRPGSSRIAGRDTTRAPSPISSVWARPPILCRRRATARTARPTSGRPSTAGSCSSAARSSHTSSRTCGSTSAASRTPS